MKNQKKEINASSMADIAFLLLIFFLVTTTIDQDKGLLNKLPSIDKPIDTTPAKKRNVLEININGNDKLWVEEKYLELEDLKDLTVSHLKNNGKNENLSESPDKAIISLKNHRSTSYDTYIMVQNELKVAYSEVRNEEAMALTGNAYNYKQLKTCIENENDKSIYCKTIKQKVKDKYPMIISEAEPVN